MVSTEELSYGRCLGNAANGIRLTKLAGEGFPKSAIDTSAEIFDRGLEPGCGLKLIEDAGRCTSLCVRIDDGSCALLQQIDGITDVIEQITPVALSA